MGFLSFCFEHFFLDRSVANLMMLTIDVCLVLNCFLFEKFYLHYALYDFDSIVLHCTELFIRQSVDREQIFDVTFQPPPPPPIEKSCVRHWLRTHGDSSTTPWKLRCELKIFLTGWKSFDRWPLHCECAETYCNCAGTARRLRKLKNA